MRTSESIAKIAPALVKAQAAMTAAAKSATNPHFKSKYSDLATVIDAVKGPLNDNGIVFIQSPANNDAGVTVTTRFQHESGEFIEDTIYLPVTTQTPQAFGSGITYAKRYGLQSMAGLPSEDDDGQAASAAPKEPNAAAANKTGKMPTKEFVDHSTAMSDAANVSDVELRRAYTKARHAADAYGDTEAAKSFETKKDQLKLIAPKVALAEQA